MSEPTVCCVMLTRDLPELAAKAVECFRRQTYGNKQLLILDSSFDRRHHIGVLEENPRIDYDHIVQAVGFTIGSLRNTANAQTQSEILIHWDDDDWSHPNRIAEQVALLQSSGVDVVGYNEMLFWRFLARTDVIETTRPGDEWKNFKPGEVSGEAWLYTGTRGGVPALGTSLCYWRRVWEQHHFANETQGVEDHWLREKNVAAVSSLYIGDELTGTADDDIADPRMIARIHGDNTSNGYKLEEYVAMGSKEWRRLPGWDNRVREILG